MARRVLILIIRLGIGVLFIVLALLLLSKVVSGSYDFGYRIFTEKSVDEGEGKDVVVLIREGMGAKEVAELLEEKGLTKDKWLFLVQYKLTGAKEIKSGTYTLNTAMTVHDIAVALSGEEETELEGEEES